MTVTRYRNNAYTGLSSDTKPTTVPASSTFLETDTGINWIYNGSSWVDLIKSGTETLTNKTIDEELNTILNSNQVGNYTVYKNGSNYKYKNWTTGVTTSNASADTLINGLISAATTGASIYFYPGFVYPLSNPIVLPTTGTVPFVFRSGGMATNAGGRACAVFQATGSFPNNRCMIEAIALPSAGGNGPYLMASDLYFYNPSFATINVGGINLETDSTSSQVNQITIERCFFNSVWRGVRIAGAGSFQTIRNCFFNDGGQSTFVGDYDVKIENAGHNSATGPFTNSITDVNVSRFGTMNNSLWLETHGCYIDNYTIDGTKYTDCPVRFDGSTSFGSRNIRMTRLFVIDIVTTGLGSTNLGSVVFNGSNCYDNHIRLAEINNAPYTAVFSNGAKKCSIECSDFDGIAINDSGAGANNVVMLYEGDASTNVGRVNSTNGLVSIYDLRGNSFGALSSHMPSRGKKWGAFHGSATSGASGMWAGGMSNFGTATGVAADTTNGAKMVFTTGGTANNSAGHRYANPSTQMSFNGRLTVRFVQGSTTNNRTYIGFLGTSADFAATDDPLASARGIIVGQRSTDTVYVIGSGENAGSGTWVNYNKDGLGGTLTVDTNPHTVEIIMVSSTNFSVRIDNNSLHTITSPLPLNTGLLYYATDCQQSATEAGHTLGIFSAEIESDK